jgi:hypothetical protein
MSISNYLENQWAKTLRGGGNGTNYTAPAAVYVKLHTGDPGEDGTANAAGETTRKAITFGVESGGVITSNVLVEWTNVSTTETYSHVSLWDASTAGNNLVNGALTSSKSVTAGDTFQLPSGQVTFTLD